MPRFRFHDLRHTVVTDLLETGEPDSCAARDLAVSKVRAGRQRRGSAQRRPSAAFGAAAITVDNGGEFVSRAMDAWAYAHDVRLDFIRPGKPVENAFIESFNGRAARRMLEQRTSSPPSPRRKRILDAWRQDYNHVRPHSSLQDRTPAAVGAMWVDSREPRESTAARMRSDRTRDRRSLRDYFAVVVLRAGQADVDGAVEQQRVSRKRS